MMLENVNFILLVSPQYPILPLVITNNIPYGSPIILQFKIWNSNFKLYHFQISKKVKYEQTTEFLTKRTIRFWYSKN